MQYCITNVFVRFFMNQSLELFSFQDAKEFGNKYFPVFVGDSIPDDIFDKYEIEAPKLMELFDGKKPKLCGTRTPMRAPVITSLVEVMTTLFSFLFNDGSRSFGESSKICKTYSESENSLIASSLFEYTGSAKQKEKEDFSGRSISRTFNPIWTKDGGGR